MAKARATHRRKQMTIPLAVVGGFVPLGVRGYNGFQANGIVGGLDGVSSGLTGYSVFDPGKWHPEVLAGSWLPILGGFAVHALAGRLGINRLLGRYRIPLFRV